MTDDDDPDAPLPPVQPGPLDEPIFDPPARKAAPVEKPVEESGKPSVPAKPLAPVESKPLESKPVESKPVESKPVESKPLEQKPLEQKPSEQKPLEQPLESKRLEPKPPVLPTASAPAVAAARPASPVAPAPRGAVATALAGGGMLDIPDDLTSGTYREADLRAAVGVGPSPKAPPVSSKDTQDSKSTKDPKLDKRLARAEARAKAKEAKEEKARTRAARRAGDDDGDGDGTATDEEGRSGRAILIWAIIIAATLGIGALIFLGYLNSGHYYLSCEPEQVVAERGRGFPPWGTRRFGDEAEWKPIKIPPEAECRTRTTDDEYELSAWYLDMLTTRANVALTAKEVTKVDEAAGMLEQALLHARTPDRSDQRKDVERLLGDVGFWRAAAKLNDAQKAMLDAAKQFDDAALRRPRHAEHASAWAAYVRRLVEELKAGPMSVKSSAFPPAPGGERPPVSPGTALPVEPGPGSSVELPAPPPADAGVPQGGVLL